MTARTGLSDLITNLRGMANAGVVDYTSGGVSFWSDDQLQTILDRHRAEIRNIYCTPVPKMVSGAVQYLDYYIGCANLESGTALAVEDGVGNAYGTATYSVDCARGIISFTSDNKGASVAVTGRSYDLNAAAADVWRMKAASVAQAYDFSTDNHRMNRSQMIKNYLEMAELYEGMQVPTVNKIYRDDLQGGGYDLDIDRR
jgi:hypothetical protein